MRTQLCSRWVRELNLCVFDGVKQKRTKSLKVSLTDLAALLGDTEALVDLRAVHGCLA